MANNFKIKTIKIVDGVPVAELHDVRKVLIKLHRDSEWSELKEVFYNKNSIWKNSSSFVFVQELTEEKLQEILSEYGEDTLIFEGFNEEDFNGEYIVVEDTMDDKEIEETMDLEEGQMVVKVKTTEGEE